MQDEAELVECLRIALEWVENVRALDRDVCESAMPNGVGRRRLVAALEARGVKPPLKFNRPPNLAEALRYNQHGWPPGMSVADLPQTGGAR